MNIVSQSFIKIPSLGDKTVRVNGDLASVYDLLTASGVTRASYRVLSETCQKFPQTGRLLTKTTFMGASVPSLAIRLEDWAELGDCLLQHSWATVSPKALQKLNQDLGITTIDVSSESPAQAIAPSVAPDVSVPDSGKKPEVTNGKLVFPELENASIRSDGNVFSVYDFIKACLNGTSARMTWASLCKTHPALVKLVYEYKFPGCKGGAARKTPTTDRKGLVQISQLLPGEFGDKFRQKTSDLILKYIDADVTLADEVVDRAVKKGKIKEVEQHAARTNGIIARKELTSTLARHGVNDPDGFRLVTNASYLGVFGTDAKGLRQKKGLKPKTNVREHMTIAEWFATGAHEFALKNGVEEQGVYGAEECARVAVDTGRQIAKLLGLNKQAS